MVRVWLVPWCTHRTSDAGGLFACSRPRHAAPRRTDAVAQRWPRAIAASAYVCFASLATNALRSKWVVCICIVRRKGSPSRRCVCFSGGATMRAPAPGAGVAQQCTYRLASSRVSRWVRQPGWLRYAELLDDRLAGRRTDRLVAPVTCAWRRMQASRLARCRRVPPVWVGECLARAWALSEAQS